MAGRVDHRHAGAPRRREQLLCWRQRLPGVLAAGAGKLAVDLAHRPAAALIGLVVKVDGEHRRIVAHIGFAPIGLINLKRLGVDHVFPAMVLEVARHGGSRSVFGLYNRCSGRREAALSQGVNAKAGHWAWPRGMACSGHGLFGAWPVRGVACSGRGLFGAWPVRGLFEVWLFAFEPGAAQGFLAVRLITADMPPCDVPSWISRSSSTRDSSRRPPNSCSSIARV